ncbi:MAG TPA: helix-turn-helix transcriptional regulator [Pedobacter sp.]|jgi:transcriptional regulator with XRE-family HTH domain
MEKYFSKKIKTVRLKLGYSQFDFAKLMQMSQIELHKIESGQIAPRIEVLSKFAEVAFYEIISPFKRKNKDKEEEEDKGDPDSLLSLIRNNNE